MVGYKESSDQFAETFVTRLTANDFFFHFTIDSFKESIAARIKSIDGIFSLFKG